jgi:hypothetical protein
MYTPEEINEIFAAYNDAIDRNIPISKELAQQMKDASIGVKNYTQQLQSSLKQLGTSVKTLGSDLAKGEKGAAVYGNSLSAGADALAAYTAKLGPAGRAFGFATKAVTAFGVAALKQSDQLFESFQKVSRAGAVGAGGMTELYDSMKKLGYVPAELERMGQLFAENSKYLALYSSSAIEGSKMFANVADTIQNSPLRAQLFNLGMSVDDINKGIAGYIKQEGALGKLRSATDRELREGTKAYLREMEILTRLTGSSREELESEREQAMQIDAFYAGLKDLGPEAREQALQVFNQMSKVSQKAAAEFAANFNGVITGSTDLLMSTGGAVRKYDKEFFARGGKAPEAMQGIADGAQQFVHVTDQIAKIGGQFGLTSREITMLTNKGLDPFREAYEKTAAEVDKAADGADRNTNAQARMRDSQIKTAQNMADFVNLGVKPATIAMEYLTKAVENLTSFLPGGKPSAAQKANAAAQEKAKAGGAGWLGQAWAGAKAGAAATFGMGGGATSSGDLANKIIQAESGGRNIANQSGAGGTATSSAFGLAQITKGTFEDLVAKAGSGNPLRGKTFEDMKADVELQKTALSQLMDQNRLFLKDSGLSTSDAAIYLAHFLGPGGAKRVLSAGDNTPIGDVISAQAISANPNLQKMSTVADLKNWADSKMGGGGYAFGGVASGPTSGYTATLHGTEAIVPLEGGRSIPVSMTPNSEQMGLMTAQLDKLDELIGVMKSQLSVSNKLLQYSS